MQAGVQRLGEISRDLSRIMENPSLKRIQFKVGMESKTATLKGAVSTLGADRAMHNFRGGRVKLGAGWDPHGKGIVVKLRPVGLWVLAEEGRKGSGDIYPKKRGRRGGGRRAVWMGKGYAHHSHYAASRGLKAITTATQNVDRASGRATDEAIRRELARIIH